VRATYVLGRFVLVSGPRRCLPGRTWHSCYRHAARGGACSPASGKRLVEGDNSWLLPIWRWADFDLHQPFDPRMLHGGFQATASIRVTTFVGGHWPCLGSCADKYAAALRFSTAVRRIEPELSGLMPGRHGATRVLLTLARQRELGREAGQSRPAGGGGLTTLLSIVSIVVVWVAHPVWLDVIEIHVKRYRQQLDTV